MGRPLFLDAQLSDEERMVRDAAKAFAEDVLKPRVINDFREESFDPAVMKEMGAIGLLGPTIPETYGGAGLNHVCYGLAAREIERIDSGYRSAMSVQSSLVMHPIHSFGSDEQKQKYLPKLAKGELVGCFGLTEPDFGSDPGGMATKAVKTDGGYHLSGSKTGFRTHPSPTLPSSGPSLMARSAVSLSSAKLPALDSLRRRLKVNCRYGHRLPGRSRWITRLCRMIISCHMSVAPKARSLA